MGLCYSENTRYFAKSKYPYAEVTPLAVILWRYFAPDAGVLVRIIYTGEGHVETLLSHSTLALPRLLLLANSWIHAT